MHLPVLSLLKMTGLRSCIQQFLARQQSIPDSEWKCTAHPSDAFARTCSRLQSSHEPKSCLHGRCLGALGQTGSLQGSFARNDKPCLAMLLCQARGQACSSCTLPHTNEPMSLLCRRHGG